MSVPAKGRVLPWAHLRFLSLHIGLPLLVGGGIYLLFRSRSLVMFSWWESLRLLPGVEALRELAAPLSSRLPGWVLYSLPDGTWLYSYIVFYRWIWAGSSSASMVFWIGVGLVMSVGLELGQGMGWLSGTFDLVDLGIYGLGGLLAFRASLPVSDPGPAARDPLAR
jgi:hypothetical protein